MLQNVRIYSQIFDQKLVAETEHHVFGKHSH